MAEATTQVPPDAGVRQSRHHQLTAGGVVLGLGLGGFIDGIVLHQILQWHHMLTDYGDHSSFPATTIPSLEDNIVWDGLFHASTWASVAIGLRVLWRATSLGHRTSGRSLVGWE